MSFIPAPTTDPAIPTGDVDLASQSSAGLDPSLAQPQLSLQTATLYASGLNSEFAGTGGPWGFDPFTSQFGGIVSSAGLATEPFSDTVREVDAGDELVFVVAVENLAQGRAYDILLRDIMPEGFAIPVE